MNFATQLVCYDRLWKIEDGNFIASRKGNHDDFNYSAGDKDAAFAGNPGGEVRALAILRGQLLIDANGGTYLLVMDEGGTKTMLMRPI